MGWVAAVLFSGWFAAVVPGAAAASDGAEIEPTLVLGVLAHRGESRAREEWGPFAEYLDAALDGYRVELEPLDNDGLQAAVERGRLDLVLTNPGSYGMLEQRFGITRIATMRPADTGGHQDRFGAVVIARADREDLVELEDLSGQRISAVHPDALWWLVDGLA